MPYKPGPVPDRYVAGFFAREFQRIDEAYNVQDALGTLLFLGPTFPQTFGVTPGQKIEAYDTVGPSPLVSDGPVQMDPRLGPDFDLSYLIDGIYLVGFNAAFTHDLGALIGFEMHFDDTPIGVGAVIDASQQTSASTVSFTHLLTVDSGGRVDVRCAAGLGTEDLVFTSVRLWTIKLRDLRTRFS